VISINGGEDDGGVVSEASTNSSSSSEPSVSEDSPPSSWRASILNVFERIVPTPSVCEWIKNGGKDGITKNPYRSG
jgi:hypothetical protein